MRKIILSLAALILCATSAFAKDYPTYDTYDIKKVPGSREGDPTRVVKLVRYPSRDANTPSLVSGDAVVWDTVSDDGVSVQKSQISAEGGFAGIVCTTIQSAEAAAGSAYEDEGRRNWGFIIVHGPTFAGATAGGTNGNSAGDEFITSADAGKITTRMASDINNGRANARSGGFFLDAAGSSTSVEVFVRAE